MTFVDQEFIHFDNPFSLYLVLYNLTNSFQLDAWKTIEQIWLQAI